MTSPAAPYAALFDTHSPEDSLWHGLPMGLHAFGGMHWVPRGSVRPASVVDTGADEYEGMYWPARHWPSLTHGTVYVVTYDLLNAWFEGDGITREEYVRTRRQWFPTHLALAWQAKDVEITLRVAMVDGDRALISLFARNAGAKPVSGRLVIRGDDNRLNYNHTDQTWGRCSAAFHWHGPSAVAITRDIQVGLIRRFFPFHAALKPEDAGFQWEPMRLQQAFAIGGTGWTQESIRSERHETWQLSCPLSLVPGETREVDIAFAGAWFGRSLPGEESGQRLAQRAEAALRESSWTDVVARNRSLWESFYKRVPAPHKVWPEDILRLYYKAWTSVYYNTIAPTDMVLFRSAHPMGVCCKVAPSTMAMCPATWESALIALCLSLVDTKLANEILLGTYQAMEPDGYLGEWPGDRRRTSLPIVEPFVAWACYRAGGDRASLDRLYPALRTNLFYKVRNPSWAVHGVHMVRNHAYSHIAARYTLRIAQALGRPPLEAAELEEVVSDTRAAVHAFWNEKGGFYNANAVAAIAPMSGLVFEEGTDAETLIPLFMAAKPDVQPCLLKMLRNEFLTDSGVIGRRPKTLPYAVSARWKQISHDPGMAGFTLKESNLMFLLKAVKDADRSLFERMAAGTLANIRRSGDFFECYDLRGHGRHNGPGSIFGAFAVIWSMLLCEDRVDELYE